MAGQKKGARTRIKNYSDGRAKRYALFLYDGTSLKPVSTNSYDSRAERDADRAALDARIDAGARHVGATWPQATEAFIAWYSIQETRRGPRPTPGTIAHIRAVLRSAYKGTAAVPEWTGSPFDLNESDVRKRRDLWRESNTVRFSTINARTSAISHLFKWAVQVGIADGDPTTNIRNLSARNDPQRTQAVRQLRRFSEDELAKLFETAFDLAANPPGLPAKKRVIVDAELRVSGNRLAFLLSVSEASIRKAVSSARLSPKGPDRKFNAAAAIAEYDGTRASGSKRYFQRLAWERWPLALFIFLQGLRTQELKRLVGGDVQFRRNASGELVAFLRIGNSKTEASEQPVAVRSKVVVGMLRAALAKIGPDEPLIPTTRQGGVAEYNTAFFRRRLRRTCELAGVEYRSPHRL